jgi:hypothetical protein
LNLRNGRHIPSTQIDTVSSHLHQITDELVRGGDIVFRTGDGDCVASGDNDNTWAFRLHLGEDPIVNTQDTNHGDIINIYREGH